MPAIGVSPAYFISRFTSGFTAAQVAEGLEEVGALGFTTFQPEVYHRESLAGWRRGGAAAVARRAADLGLGASQLVAHFLMPAFGDAQGLAADQAGDLLGVLECAEAFPACPVVTVPLGPFQAPPSPRPGDYAGWFARCADKVADWGLRAAAGGRRLALEILPGSLAGGLDGFLRLCERLGADAPGLNFDSGHAWAAKENLDLAPAKLAGRLLGTHLCDNHGHANLSLRPGAGSIDWPRVLGALAAAGYRGAYDLEIICPPEEVRREYGQGRAFVAACLSELAAGPPGGRGDTPC